MRPLPIVITAQYRGEYRILLGFSDGLEGIVDFSQWLHGPVFKPLEDLDFFRRFYIDGGTVAWPNGADIAPETLHEQANATSVPNPPLQPTGYARG